MIRGGGKKGGERERGGKRPGWGVRGWEETTRCGAREKVEGGLI